MGFWAKLFRMEDGFAPGANDAYTTTGQGRFSRRWTPSAFGPNTALDFSSVPLRNQTRELMRKNALASAAMERIVSNVVGTGIKPQISDQAVQKLWTKWVRQSAVDGQLDFYGQQCQVMRSIVESGECFVRHRPRRADDGIIVPYQVEVLESEFVPIEYNTQLPSGAYIRQGIEFDPVLKAKRVAYYVRKVHPNDQMPGAPNPSDWVRVPASEICHVFWPGRPGQLRGEPWMVRVLDRLRDVESYDKAELVRKKTAAMLVGFIKRTLPEGVSAEDLAEVWGDDATISGGVGDVSLEPGTMQFLQPGEDVEFAAPSDVGGQYEVFMRAQHRAIAASLGILYEQLTGDYSTVNDRTWRAAVNDFRRRCEQWQHHLLVFQFCQPVFQRWAQLAELVSLVPAGTEDLEIKWTPPAWPYINPVQDVQAKREEIRSGLTSRSAVLSEMGEDAAVIDAENKADQERTDKMNLTYDSDARVAVSKGAGLPTTTGTEGASVNAGKPAAKPGAAKPAAAPAKK